jgi:hypothetical protein
LIQGLVLGFCQLDSGSWILAAGFWLPVLAGVPAAVFWMEVFGCDSVTLPDYLIFEGVFDF